MSRRVGLIGGGRWGEVQRRALLSAGATLAAGLVASEESSRRLQREWAVPVHKDLEEFLACDMEAVVIASPNHLHAPHSLAALSSGRHVLVEKPMAISVEDCEAMIAAAARAGLVLAVGHEMRHFTLFEEVRRLLQSGVLGQPLHLKLDLWRRPYRKGASGWKTDPKKIGSTILEEPIHYLDLARWWLGEPVELQAWATSRAGGGNSWDNLDIRLEHRSRARSWVTRSIAAFGHRVTVMLVGQQGSLRASWSGALDMDEHPQVELVFESDGAVEPLPVPAQTGHAFELHRQTAAFLAALERPLGLASSGLATGDDGLAAVALCLAAQRSLEGRSSVVEL